MAFFVFVPFVLFAEGAPQLLYKFIEQTMQPGPSVSLKCKLSFALFSTFNLTLLLFSCETLLAKDVSSGMRFVHAIERLFALVEFKINFYLHYIPLVEELGFVSLVYLLVNCVLLFAGDVLSFFSLFHLGSATGNPTPQITWKLDGFKLPEVRSF